jgi:hypothetical protein
VILGPDVVIAAVVSAAIIGGIVAVGLYRRRGGRVSRWWGVGLLWIMVSALPLSVFAFPPPDSPFDWKCPLPGQDSTFGASTWQTWPPGTVCYDLEGNVTSEPRGFYAIVVLVAAGGSLAFLGAAVREVARARRRRSEVDRDPGREAEGAAGVVEEDAEPIR